MKQKPASLLIAAFSFIGNLFKYITSFSKVKTARETYEYIQNCIAVANNTQMPESQNYPQAAQPENPFMMSPASLGSKSAAPVVPSAPDSERAAIAAYSGHVDVAGPNNPAVEVDNGMNGINNIALAPQYPQQQGGTGAASIPFPSAQSSPKSFENDTSSKKSKIIGICAILGVLLVIGAFIGYQYFYVPYATDRDALRTYVVADNLFLRSEKLAGVEHNILTKVTYGSELITYEKDSEWAKVKYGKTEGYVASPYLIEKDGFDILSSAWGDNDARTCIESNKCRFAVVDYFKRNNMQSGSGAWQIYTKAKDVKPNNVFFPRLYSPTSKFTDFMFIVKDNSTSTRKLVAYSFEDETEKPIFRFDKELPYDYGNASIKSAKASNGNAIITFDNNATITVPLN